MKIETVLPILQGDSQPGGADFPRPGECHFHAPHTIPFPATSFEDFCGQFKSKP